MAKETQKRITLEDVAAKANVSRATVSRVVRQVPGVDEEIVSRVTKAIAKTGYKTNLAARALAGGKTQNVAIVFRENFADIFMNGAWGQVLEGIHSVLESTNHQLTFLINLGDHAKGLPQYLLSNHVDGAIFLGTTPDDRIPLLLQKNNIPVVALGEPYQASKLSCVNGDDFAAGEIAAAVLLDGKSKQIGIISGSEELATSHDRVHGFRKGLAERGYTLDENLIAPGGYTMRGGYEAIEALLKRAPNLDGVFISSDLMAVGALQNLARLNKKVPKDISVVSYDNSPSGEFTNPKLSTIHCNPIHVGASSAELLRDLMNGGPVRSLVFPPELIVRESTR
jgi:DNA-binding LacI/PurR family transcriptional regulator